jgi:hypothetical protein
VGIEASGPMHWFLELLEELGIERQVGLQIPVYCSGCIPLLALSLLLADRAVPR